MLLIFHSRTGGVCLYAVGGQCRSVLAYLPQFRNTGEWVITHSPFSFALSPVIGLYPCVPAAQACREWVVREKVLGVCVGRVRVEC